MRTCVSVVCVVVGLCGGAQAGQLVLASVPWAGGLDTSPKLVSARVASSQAVNVTSFAMTAVAPARPEPAAVTPAAQPKLASAEPDLASRPLATAAPATGPTKSSPSPAKSAATTVMASFYDTGRITANGEPFAPMGLTAAHRSLPFGTKLRVTNKRTGQSIVVRVNDRGPYIAGRSLDLSRGAARAIGMEQAGVIPITMEVVSQ